MKIAVTITQCIQIGMETWQDFSQTKVFEDSATIKEIDEWIKSKDKNSGFNNAKISLCVD